MNHFRRGIGRAGARMLLLAGALLMAACATGERGGGPVGLPDEGEASNFNRGRLSVVIVDQNGQAVDRARIDLESDRPGYYRTSAFTNRQGSVMFTGVPQDLRVNVFHPYGSYSQPFHVPATGVSELRLIVVLDYPPPPPPPEPEPRRPQRER